MAEPRVRRLELRFFVDKRHGREIYHAARKNGLSHESHSFKTVAVRTQARYADWHNDVATGVFADTSRNLYLTGYTIGDRLPVTRTVSQAKRKDDTEPFVRCMKLPC